jgi:hypothetical protein
MVRQVARQFCRLGEVHGLVYGRRASGKTDGETGRKLTASTRLSSQSRLIGLSGFNQRCDFYDMISCLTKVGKTAVRTIYVGLYQGQFAARKL